MDPAQGFAQKYDVCMTQLQAFEFTPETAKILGARLMDNAYTLDFFNKKVTVSAKGVQPSEGPPLSDAVKVLLIKYLLLAPDQVHETSNRLVTFREFSDAGPLFSSFTTNTAKIIETTFSGRLDTLRDLCARLGGRVVETASLDLSVRFRALHRIPVILNFNDQDEMLGACLLFIP